MNKQERLNVIKTLGFAADNDDEISINTLINELAKTINKEQFLDNWKNYNDEELDELLLNNKIGWIKRFREVVPHLYNINVGLKEAKDIVDMRYAEYEENQNVQN